MPETNVASIARKGAPSAEAHELVIITDKRHPLYDERVENDVTDERVINFAVAGQAQPILVSVDGDRLIVVEGRQRVKRALVINHLTGRHIYRGEIQAVKAAIERLTGTDKGKRIVEECPRGIKVLVAVHRGDQHAAARASTSANEHRDDDTIERKIRRAQWLASKGFSNAEIADDFGKSEQTIERWLARDLDKPKTAKARAKRGALTRVKAKQLFERLVTDAPESLRKLTVIFGWVANENTKADVLKLWPELEKYASR